MIDNAEYISVSYIGLNLFGKRMREWNTDWVANTEHWVSLLQECETRSSRSAPFIAFIFMKEMAKNLMNNFINEKREL